MVEDDECDEYIDRSQNLSLKEAWKYEKISDNI